MKKDIRSIVTIVCFFCFLQAHSQFVSIVSNKFVVNGSSSCPIYFNGCNNPWEAWNDFGGSYNVSTWNQDMINLKTNGINTARIWFSCNGSGQPSISATGVTSAPTAAFWQNCDSLFASAQRNGVYIMATMMSFDHTKTANANSTNWQQMLNSQANVTTYVNNYIIPFINRYKTNPYLWSIDICNEIEWIYENRTGSGDGSNWGSATYPILQRFVAMCAAGIHNNPRTDGTTVLATVGSAGVKWNGSLLPNGSTNPDGNKWSDANLKAQYNQTNAILDFYSPHYYGWMEQYNSSPFEKTPAQFGMSEKPCMVGEMPAQSPIASDYAGYATTTMTLTSAFNNLLSLGWQGHQPWTANITTNLDKEVGDLATFGSFALAFYNTNKTLVRPTCAITPKCQAPNLGVDQSLCGITGGITLNANITTATNKIFTWYKGTTVVTGTTGTLSGITTAGTYIVKVDSASGTCVATDTVIISSTIATPTLTGAALCSPATMTLNSGVSGTGLSYKWSLGGTVISSATASTLANVRTAGTYSVSVSASGCTTTSASATVTSTNPTPVDGCNTTAGAIALSISNNTGTNYAWYSSLTGGTSLGTGLTFTTPSVSATTTYYVQNMSSVNTSVGPTTTLAGTNTDWGVGTGYQMQFTPLADFSILSMQVPMNIYNAGTMTMVIEIIDGSGNPFSPAKTFTGTSSSLTASNNQMVSFTFTNLTILKSWGSTLRMRVSSVSAGSPLFTNATAAVPYPYTVANVVSITGSVGTAGNMYNYFYNWNISTGSACDRLPVIASISASCGTACATVAPIVSTINYCQASTATALTATGTSLLWYTVATGGTGSTTAPIPSTATAGSTSYYVSQTLTGCEGPRALITVAVNAIPTTSAGSAISLCKGSATTITATGGTSYVWSTSATTGSINVTPTATTTYIVTTSNASNCKATASVIVTVNPIPAAPIVTTPVNYNQNDIASILTATGSNLLWYTTSTGGIGSSTGITPSTTTIGSTNYYVSQTTTNCESPRATINVVVALGTYTQTISLLAGWNIISFNVTPANSSIESVFATVLTNLTEVKNADAFWENGQAITFNSLTKINDGAGYLVYLKTASTLTVSGISVVTPISLILKTGWNLAGVPSQTAANIVTKIGSNPITSVKDFDGFWNLSGVPSITTFDPGKGYFIYATSPTSIGY